jgi:hypothetical protein
LSTHLIFTNNSGSSFLKILQIKEPLVSGFSKESVIEPAGYRIANKNQPAVLLDWVSGFVWINPQIL